MTSPDELICDHCLAGGADWDGGCAELRGGGRHGAAFPIHDRVCVDGLCSDARAPTPAFASRADRSAFASLARQKLQGRTLPKLVLSVCKRSKPPWMTLAAWYVLVSRVRTLDSLRLLQLDQAGLASLKGLKHDEHLAAWSRGYDERGRWSDELAVAAYKNVQRARQSDKQKRADAKKKATADAKKKATADAKKKATAGVNVKKGASAKRVASTVTKRARPAAAADAPAGKRMKRAPKVLPALRGGGGDGCATASQQLEPTAACALSKFETVHLVGNLDGGAPTRRRLRWECCTGAAVGAGAVRRGDLEHVQDKLCAGCEEAEDDATSVEEEAEDDAEEEGECKTYEATCHVCGRTLASKLFRYGRHYGQCAFDSADQFRYHPHDCDGPLGFCGPRCFRFFEPWIEVMHGAVSDRGVDYNCLEWAKEESSYDCQRKLRAVRLFLGMGRALVKLLQLHRRVIERRYAPGGAGAREAARDFYTAAAPRGREGDGDASGEGGGDALAAVDQLAAKRLRASPPTDPEETAADVAAASRYRHVPCGVGAFPRFEFKYPFLWYHSRFAWSAAEQRDVLRALSAVRTPSGVFPVPGTYSPRAPPVDSQRGPYRRLRTWRPKSTLRACWSRLPRGSCRRT